MRATDGVWAVGDLTGAGVSPTWRCTRPAIVSPTSWADRCSADYRALPRVTFTDPEVGAVGLTEAGGAAVRGSRCEPGPRNFDLGQRRDPQGGNAGSSSSWRTRRWRVGRGDLVGVVGGEFLGMLTLAIQSRCRQAAAHMIYAYPTFHRAIEPALRDLQTA